MKHPLLKKSLSLIIMLTIILSSFPCLSALAAKEMFTTVSSVSINEVAQPSVGSTPLYSANIETKGCKLQNSNNDYSVNGIAWYESSSEGSIGTQMKTTAKCRPGYYYTIVLTLVRSSTSYSFGRSVTATVNGKTARVNNDFDSTKRVVYYQFPMCMATVSSVDIQLTAPVAGAKPSYTQVKGTGYESNNSRNNASSYKNGIIWQEVDTGRYLYPDSSDVFKYGMKYMARVMIGTTKGYVYTSNPTAKVNGKTAVVDKVDKEFLSVDYTFTATGTAITKVDLTIPKAIAEKYPSFPKVNTASYESKNSDPKITNQANGIIWRTGSTNLTVNNLFKADKTYSVFFYLYPKAGYGWSANVSATINGESAVVSRNGECIIVSLSGIKPTVPHTHTASDWKSDASGHFKVCTGCGEEIAGSRSKHTPGAAATEKNPQKCTVCSYIITPAKGHTHSLTKVAAKSAKCTVAGNIEYYTCSGCSDWFKDSAAKTKITDKNSVTVNATGHKKGSLRCDDTAHWNACSVCNEAMPETSTPHYDKDNDNTCDACGNAINGAPGRDPSMDTKPPVDTPKPPVSDTDPPAKDTDAPVIDTTDTPADEPTNPDETKAEPEENDTNISPDITASPDEDDKNSDNGGSGTNEGGTNGWVWIVVAVVAGAVVGSVIVGIVVSKKKKN